MNIEKIKAAALAIKEGKWSSNNYAFTTNEVLQLITRLEAAEKCLFQMQNAAIDLGKKLEAAEKAAAKVAGWQADGESAAIEIREMAKENGK